jgi:hypothetical protein
MEEMEQESMERELNSNMPFGEVFTEDLQDIDRVLLSQKSSQRKLGPVSLR